ncbi:glycosyltransferase [Microvirga tunisiensis]|uniref:Glycosyltransferase n=1 Tax=Pannonibacter tanglangensis TaxID=2750084 RepID=A0A7X5EZD4_9HYPH|nr:glycosyltransferase family 4 protein [Pannonibacter sp. XCT-53]NBN76714.1 glycosyltransferase [Pannonibacter sp. XCT-53]
MIPPLTFAHPGDLAINTGGYAYDRRVIAELREAGVEVTPLPLGPGFPAPAATTLALAEARLSALPDDSLVLVDGLAFGVLDDWAGRHAARLRLVALVHHPLALETGLTEADRLRLEASERRALACVQGVIVTSPATARTLVAAYGVEADRITVAVPGTDPGRRSPCDGDPARILSIGTLTRRKGHDVLISALKRIEHLPWQATLIGSRTLDPVTAAGLATQIEALGLGARITLAGERATVRDDLARADIFALASRYEGYGMAFAEALAHGLPVVACRAGAVPEVVPPDAGLLVPPEDPDALADALARLVSDRTLRRHMADAAAQAGAALPGWPETATRIARHLATVAQRGREQ